MRRIASSLAILLLTGVGASALPCAESYSEYSEKLELLGFTKEGCPRDMEKVDELKYGNVCILKETGANWTTATAWWATPRDWRYAEKERAGKVFGFTLLFKPPVGFCVPPNIEAAVPFQHPAKLPFDESNSFIGSAFVEAFLNWFHPNRFLF